MNKKISRKIGFIIHPVDTGSFFNMLPFFYKKTSVCLAPLLKEKNLYHIIRAFSHVPAHKVFHIKNIGVDASHVVDLICVMCPLLPKEMLANKAKVLQKMRQAFRIFEREKVDVITLAAFSSISTNGGEDLKGFTDIPITSGNALTAVLSIDLIKAVAHQYYANRDDLILSVIGATGDIGSACARELAGCFQKVVLCSRTVSLDSDVVRQLERKNFILVHDVKEAVRDADIVLTCASTFGTLLSADDFKKNAIICDVGMPPNVGRMFFDTRRDAKVFDGGRGSISFYDQVHHEKWKALFPKNAIFGCFLEALIIALSGRWDLVSTGRGEISAAKIQTLRSLASEFHVSFSKDCEVCDDVT